MTEATGEVRTDPRVERLRDEVWEGLGREPRALSSRWFYDHRGSELFEEITRLPEYYPTRTELTLLEAHAEGWVERLGTRALIELGAGSARKTRVLLDAMRQGGLYVPTDVSGEFLEATTEAVREEYPALDVRPWVSDLTRPLELPFEVPRPALVALLGSTIGNFGPAAARSVLRHVRSLMGPRDAFLLGADLRPGPEKPLEVLEAAYNDARGVTAEFNRNMLRVLNREAGTDFPVESFEHRAFYAEAEGRIEMHLVAREAVDITVPERGRVRFAAGDGVRTEISCKYDRATVEAMLAAADMVLETWVTDPDGRYALVIGGPA